ERDREAAGRDPERVIELTRDVGVADELAAQHAGARIDPQQERRRESRAGAALQQVPENDLGGASARSRGGRRDDGSRRGTGRRGDGGGRLEATGIADLAKVR